MTTFWKLCFFSLCLIPEMLFPHAARASLLRVQTTTTELAWLAQEIGQGTATVRSFLNGSENPHYADATPSFALWAKRADVVVSVGLDLEAAWLPRTLQRSGNRNVQPGISSSGFCEVGGFLEVHGVAKGTRDRSMGHLHSKGNPHFWYSLQQTQKAAEAIYSCLKSSIRGLPDPELTLARLEQNMAALRARFQLESEKLERLLETRRGSPISVVQIHEDFEYFLAELNLSSWGSLEDKPGIKPSAGRISKAAKQAKLQNVPVLLYSTLDSEEMAAKFTEVSGIPGVQLQAHLRRDPDGTIQDFFSVYWNNVNQVIAALESAH